MSGSREAESTARSFSLPAWMNGSAGVTSEDSIETLPLATSVNPGTAPLYGIWRISTPVASLNCSAKI